MPREDLLATDKEKTRAKAEIRRFLTRLAVFAALCWVLFGVVFGLAVVPGSTMVPPPVRRRPRPVQPVRARHRGRAGRALPAGRHAPPWAHRGAWRRYRHCDRHRRTHHQRRYGGRAGHHHPHPAGRGRPGLPRHPRGGRAFPAVRCPHHGGRTAASTAPSHSGKCWARPWPPCAAAGCKPCCNPQRKQHKSMLEERNHL